MDKHAAAIIVHDAERVQHEISMGPLGDVCSLPHATAFADSPFYHPSTAGGR